MATAVPVQVLTTFQKNIEFTSTLNLLRPALSKKIYCPIKKVRIVNLFPNCSKGSHNWRNANHHATDCSSKRQHHPVHADQRPQPAAASHHVRRHHGQAQLRLRTATASAAATGHDNSATDDYLSHSRFGDATAAATLYDVTSVNVWVQHNDFQQRFDVISTFSAIDV